MLAGQHLFGLHNLYLNKVITYTTNLSPKSYQVYYFTLFHPIVTPVT